jgi:glycolate oxidase FAD binding subunit
MAPRCGGIVATTPRGRGGTATATIRELIIGITVVLADGRWPRPAARWSRTWPVRPQKLFTGSLGTLGVIAECNFRLHPRPETPAPSRSSSGARSRGGGGAGDTARPARPERVELHWSEDEKTPHRPHRGIEPASRHSPTTASYLLRGFGEVRTLTDEEAGTLGRSRRRARERGGGQDLRPPVGVDGVLDSALGACSRRGVAPRITGHAGIGVTYVGLSGGDEEAHAQVVEELREIWLRRGGSVVVREAPPAFKERVEVWGP